MTTSLQLGFLTNGGVFVGGLELAGAGATDAYTIHWTGIDDPGPAPRQAFAGGPWRAGAELAQETDELRTLGIPLTVHGHDITALEQAWAALGRYLTALRDYRRTRRGDTPAIQRVWASGATVYYLPLSGRLTPPGSAAASIGSAGTSDAFQPPDLTATSDGPTIFGATLSFLCAPYLEGGAIAVPAGSTQTNGSVTLSLPPLPGDVPARLRVSVTDQSTSGAINRIRISGVALSQLPDGADLSQVAWTHAFALPASTPASVGTWATNTDSDAIGGQSIRFTPSSNAFDFTTVARVTVSANTAPNSGNYVVLARVRDNASLATPAIYSWRTLSGGSLTQGVTYSYVVTALSAGGETIASNQLNVYLATNRSYKAIQLYWYAVNGATSYHVYRSTNGGSSWAGYFATSSTNYTDTGATPSAGSPPTTSTATVSGALSQYRLQAGWLGDAADNLVTLGTTTTVIGGTYELITFPNVATLPPGRLPAGYGNPGWQVQLQARRTTTLSGSIDLDELLVIPADTLYAEFNYASGANAVKGVWVAEQHRDEGCSAVLTDGSGTVLSALAGGGTLTPLPGAGKLYVTAHTTNDAHSVAHTSLTVGATAWPRYRHFAG